MSAVSLPTAWPNVLRGFPSQGHVVVALTLGLVFYHRYCRCNALHPGSPPCNRDDSVLTSSHSRFAVKAVEQAQVCTQIRSDFGVIDIWDLYRHIGIS